MGGPFRAVVGGAKQTMSFAPAQAIQLDNYSTQYGHLVKSDVFVAPGQIGMVILVDGITAEIFEFAAPPSASQAAATNGQICLIRTFDEAAGPGAPPPLTPGVGVLLPIGLDSPQHFHSHSNLHLHPHTATHAHGIPSDSTASSGHTHSSPGNHSHTQMWGSSNTGAASAGTAHTHPYNDPNNFGSSGTETGLIPNSAAGTNAESGHSHGHTHGGTFSAAPGSTDTASPGNSDLENVQHTHP